VSKNNSFHYGSENMTILNLYVSVCELSTIASNPYKSSYSQIPVALGTSNTTLSFKIVAVSGDYPPTFVRVISLTAEGQLYLVSSAQISFVPPKLILTES